MYSSHPHAGWRNMMQSCRAALILLCLSTAVPAIAQQQEQPEKPRQVRSVVIYGDDPCPEGKEGEIIVCARKPESERYRVPEEVRKAPQPPPAARSWKERADIVEDATQATRPNTCSTVAAVGQNGSPTEILKQCRPQQPPRLH